MIRIADATFDDLTYIGSWLCAADRQELAVTRDPDDYVGLANAAARSPLCKVALDHAATPIFAFGAEPIPGTVMAQVWGFKCDSGWTAILTVTKYIRRIMIPQLREMGIRHAVCIVHPDNSRSLKWLTRNLDFRARATLTGFGTRNEDMILMQRDEPDAPAT
jgi:hypothetical protein